MKHNTVNSRNSYYDLNSLRNISIEDLCYRIGLDVERRGSRLWVKLRNENTASAIINSEENTIYDFGEPYMFGTNSYGGPKPGDPFDLIQYIYSCDFIEAKERLANMFNIEPLNQKQKNHNYELSFQEYAQIGVYGDKVSKNLNFDPDLSSQELFDLADKFSISVNELKKSQTEELLSIYEDVILRGKALPYIQQMRNSYFVSIWEQYSFLKDINALELFDTVCSQKELTDMYKKIVSAEKIFNRAAEGTKVKKLAERDYSPDKILEDILKKRIKPELGLYNYKKINMLAKKENCTVKYEAIEPAKYYELKEQFDSLPHRAFFSEEQVIVGYLSKDIEKIDTLMGRVHETKTMDADSLDNMVTHAENRKNNSEMNNPMIIKQNDKGVNAL